MKIIRSVSEMQESALAAGRKGVSTGFVPTMGALHAGHLSLIQRAKSESDRVVVSIFVNPLQFGPKEDYSRYPRPIKQDQNHCKRLGVDILYLPTAAEMYPDGFKTHVGVKGITSVLEGKFRPGHFDGVATVVLKLFEQTRPNQAYFGEKDYQQLLVIRRMTRDLNLPVKIIGCPTVRENDGLALSSRNAYLAPEERAWAPHLNKALREGAALGSSGRKNSVPLILARMRRRVMQIPGVKIDYLSIADSQTLEPAESLSGALRILAAIRIGKTRLIDNVPLICKD